MTLDEAIKHCEEVAQENEKQFNGCPMKYEGAYANNGKTACKCAEEHRQLTGWLKELKALKELEPCEDCISKHAALELLQMKYFGKNLYKAIYELPSVTPARPKGKWIKHISDLYPADSTMECSRCKHEQPLIIDDSFCPNCGAEMEAEK